MSKLATLLVKDARGLGRDGMLATLAVFPLVLALITRLAAGEIPVEYIQVYLAPAALLVGPGLLGTIFGFLLIEEREQRTWLLLRVVPLRQSALVGYLVGTTTSFATVVVVLSALVYGLPPVQLASFAVLVVASALTAPLLALALGTVAENKIQGFAMAKLMGVFPMLPGLVFVMPGAWLQWLLAWNPYYWIYVGLLRAWVAEAQRAELAVSWPGGPEWLWSLLPFLLCATGIGWLARLYRRRAG